MKIEIDELRNKLLNKTNCFWSVKNINKFIKNEYSLNIPKSTTREYIKRMGFSFEDISNKRKFLLSINNYKKLKEDAKIEKASIFLVNVEESIIKVIKLDSNEFFFLLDFDNDFELFFNKILDLYKIVFIVFEDISGVLRKHLIKKEKEYKNRLVVYKFNYSVNYSLLKHLEVDNSTQKINLVNFYKKENKKRDLRNEKINLVNFYKEEKKKRDLRNEKRRENYKNKTLLKKTTSLIENKFSTEKKDDKPFIENSELYNYNEMDSFDDIDDSLNEAILNK
ncbi:hypothetical protein [Arcobacter sp. YIC-310]|uniref:hypothetical protein n=1 Tax=Arcobacter sp. YIC-310 TaxID=3376632 RepID=UPI003C21A0B0